MKLQNINRTIQLFFVFLLLAIGSAKILAQTEKPKVSQDEANAAKKIEAAKDFPAKLKAASDFFKKYAKTPLRSNIVNYLAEQTFASKDNSQSVINSQAFMAMFTDPAETDLIVPSLINSFISLESLGEAFATAEKFLPRHPEEVTVRLQLAIEGEKKFQANDDKYLAPTKLYAAETIKLIEANKKPEKLDDAAWKEYQTKWLAELHATLGFADVMSSNKTEAQKSFLKSVSIDEGNISSWYMLGFLANEEYQDLASQYQLASGKEQADLLVKANTKLDSVIDLFARVVALTDGVEAQKALNTGTRQDLENYYKYRHKGSTAGMQELIDKFKSKKII